MIHVAFKVKLLIAVGAASKKALIMSPFMFAAILPLGLAAVFQTLGTHGTAYVFALIASLLRWPLFRLGTRDALVGVISIPVLAYIFVNIHPPWLDGVLYLSAPEDYPMIFGTVFGLIPNLLGGWLIDFASAFVHARAKAAVK